jgi:uncharacterized HAD superfamily protein
MSEYYCNRPGKSTLLNVRSVADLNAAIMANIHRLDRDQFDIVCGIPRSGMLPATILATQLQLPLATVESLTRGIVYGRSGERQNVSSPRVLLVDDTVNHGRAMAQAVKAIGKRHASEITRFCVFGPYRGDLSIVDMFCEIVPGPRAFEWNIAKHRRLCRWGFDMDGVICRDPTKDENDDGGRYVQFMRSAEPLFIPRRPIGHVVTCRLEKYRNETEAQLKRYGVEFGQLHMMQYGSKAERMAAGGRGSWKAGIVREIGTEFFIESCPKQAGIIAREAGIPVWCTRTQSLARTT